MSVNVMIHSVRQAVVFGDVRDTAATRHLVPVLAFFLVPVTVTMHAFWAVPDPQAAQLQSVMFFKNVALLGAALLMIHFGAGPVSVDARRDKSDDGAADLRQHRSAA